MGKLVKESLYEKFLTICRGVLFGILVVKVCFIGENQAATVSGNLFMRKVLEKSLSVGLLALVLVVIS